MMFQPQRPVSTYVDPADRVAATSNKVKADDIQTWSISEIDKKGKKKKGTLGVGSGAVFFTSESDKVCFTDSSLSDNALHHEHATIGASTKVADCASYLRSNRQGQVQACTH